MRPIPRSMLIHSVLLVASSKTDVWQNQTDGGVTELSYVRVDPSSKVVISKDNTELQLSSTLIYDCHNSRPTGITFKPEQTIKWNNQDYKIITAEPLYDSNKLHHWELGLI